MEWEACRTNPSWFLSYCCTEDPHDKEHPIKPFPTLQKQYHYARKLLDLCVVAKEPLIVEKSRQMMATWLMCGYFFWRAMFYPHQAIYFSKLTKDAANLELLRRRIDIMYKSISGNNMPDFLRGHLPTMDGKYCERHFTNGSMICAVSQNPEDLRGPAASGVLIDEAAMLDRLEDFWNAVIPMVVHGGQLMVVSTPLGEHNFFYRLTHGIKSLVRGGAEAVA